MCQNSKHLFRLDQIFFSLDTDTVKAFNFSLHVAAFLQYNMKEPELIWTYDKLLK